MQLLRGGWGSGTEAGAAGSLRGLFGKRKGKNSGRWGALTTSEAAGLGESRPPWGSDLLLGSAPVTELTGAPGPPRPGRVPVKVRGSLSEPLCGAHTRAVHNCILKSEKVTLLPRAEDTACSPALAFCVCADGLGQRQQLQGRGPLSLLQAAGLSQAATSGEHLAFTGSNSHPGQRKRGWRGEAGGGQAPLVRTAQLGRAPGAPPGSGRVCVWPGWAFRVTAPRAPSFLPRQVCPPVIRPGLVDRRKSPGPEPGCWPCLSCWRGLRHPGLQRGLGKEGTAPRAPAAPHPASWASPLPQSGGHGSIQKGLGARPGLGSGVHKSVSGRAKGALILK